MSLYFDRLCTLDRSFVNWVFSSNFPYEYVLVCVGEQNFSYQISSKNMFRQLIDDTIADAVQDPDNYDIYDHGRDSLACNVFYRNKTTDVMEFTDKICVGFNLSDDIYEVFSKLEISLTKQEVYNNILDIINDNMLYMDDKQQYNTVKEWLKSQASQPLMQSGITQDDINDLFEMKLPTFKQFYHIVCENTKQNMLDEIQKFLEEYPNIIERTKKYISHCIYELQRETVPLYYAVIKQLKIIPTLDIDTLAVDACGNLWFNPLFVQNELIKDGDDSMLKGVLVHEAMHLIDRTQARVITAHRSAYNKATSADASGEDIKVYQLIHEIGNFAYDLIINRDVMKEGFKLPEFGIIAKKDKNGHYMYEFDFTTKNDKQPDIKRVDVSRFTGEKAYHMFVGAYKYVVDKLYKQGKLTQKQYERCTILINTIQQ